MYPVGQNQIPGRKKCNGQTKLIFQTISNFRTYLFPLLLHSMLLSGCATYHKTVLDIAPEFRPYVSLFQIEALDRGKQIVIEDLIIRFGPMRGGEVGQCWQFDDSTPTIVVDAEIWQLIGYYEREILVFHELGHCILGREHRNSLDDNGMPKSIMYKHLFNEYYYETYREKYLNELFGHAKLY